MKEYVRIQSSISIVVTAGLQNEDVTNPDAHVPDRLKINPIWPKLKIMLKAGSHVYPSFITEWETVKSLQKDGIITIGEELDNANEEETKAAIALKEEVEIASKKLKKVKDIKLEEVSD